MASTFLDEPRDTDPVIPSVLRIAAAVGALGVLGLMVWAAVMAPPARGALRGYPCRRLAGGFFR